MSDLPQRPKGQKVVALSARSKEHAYEILDAIRGRVDAGEITTLLVVGDGPGVDGIFTGRWSSDRLTTTKLFGLAEEAKFEIYRMVEEDAEDDDVPV